MKRILVFALALILAFSSLAVPSYAASDDSPWIELLDYITLTDSGNMFSFNSSKTLSVSLPFQTSMAYIDVVASWSLNPITGVTLKHPTGGSLSLNVVDLGDNLIRIYGEVPKYTYSTFDLIFTSSGSTYCTFLSMKVSSKVLNGFGTPVSGYLYAGGESVDFYYDGGRHVSASISDLSSSATWDFFIGFDFTEWIKFDFIDVSFSVSQVSSITSITANVTTADGDLLGTYLELDYSYISNSFYNDGSYEIVCRIDLSTLNRSAGYGVVLFVDGEHSGTSLDFFLASCIGYVVDNAVEPDVFFLQKIWKEIVYGFQQIHIWIQNQTDAIVQAISSLDQSGSMAGNFADLKTWIESQTAAIQSSFEDLDSWIQDQTTALSTSISSMSDRLYNVIGQFNSNVNTWILNQAAAIQSNFEDLDGWIQDQTTALSTSISSMSDRLYNVIGQFNSNVNTWILNQTAAVQSYFEDLDGWLQDQTSALSTSISSMSDRLYNVIGLFNSNVGTWITNQTNTLNDSLKSMSDRLYGVIGKFNENVNIWIQNQTNAILAALGVSGDNEGFNQDVQNQGDKLDDMEQVMDSVNKPSFDSVNVDPGAFVNQSDVQLLVSPIAVIYDVPIFKTILLMSIMMATAGYVLFGKR